MTGDDLLKVCLAQIGHTKESNPAANEYFLGILNVVLAECLNIEEAYRRLNYLDILGDAPFITSMDENIGYSNHVLLNVVSKGISARLAGEEDNQMLANYYGTMYENAKVKAIGTAYVDTENIAQSGEVW